MSKTNAEIKD
jgi:hypothetical protein